MKIPLLRSNRTDEDRWLAGALLLFAFTLPITISISEAVAFLLVPLWWWRRKRGGLPGPAGGARGLIVGVFVAVAVLASLMGLRPGHSLEKSLNFLLLSVSFLVPVVALPAGGLPRRLIGAFLAGATLKAAYDLVRIPVGAWITYQRLLGQPVAGPEMPHTVSLANQALFSQGTMRDPQFYLVALCLLVAGWAAGGRRARDPAFWIPLAVLGAALLLHFKRGALAATVVALVLMGVLARKNRLLAVLAVALLAIFAVPQVRERAAMVRNEFTLSLEGRYPLWTQAAPSLLRAHPFGVGWRALTHEKLKAHTKYVQRGLNHLHNNLLQVAVELGWLGAAAWLVWMLAEFLAMARRRAATRTTAGPPDEVSLGVLCGFLGLMIVGVVEYNFGDAEIFMLLSLLWGLAAAAPASDGRSPA